MTWGKSAFLIAVLALAGCVMPDADDPDLQIRLDRRAVELGAFLETVDVQAIADQPAGNKTLLVRLAFGPEADLDLYVTDPQLETVYFANHRSKSGGQISADSRCGGDAIRIEEVRFEVVLAGRYRVGIDYPEGCDGATEPAAHAVSVIYNGKRLDAHGSVSLRQFEVIVLEFDIDAMEMKEAQK